MDLHMTDLVLFGNDFAIPSHNKSNWLGGNLLSLDCQSSRGSKPARVGHHSMKDDGCDLILGLGPTPGFCCNNSIDSAAQKVPNLVNDFDPMMLQLALPSDIEEPSVTMENASPSTPQFLQSSHRGNSPTSLVSDEGSTSARLSYGGYIPSLLLAPHSDTCSMNGGTPTDHNSQNLIRRSPELSAATTDGSLGVISDPFSTIHKVHDLHAYRHHPKKCRFDGCSKGARGASGLCIAHGGGQRCLKPGCHKGAESRTAFCKAHGGGRRCQQLGCTKSAEGKTDFCIVHGGGRRCRHPGCLKAARGKSGLCIRHGGGKRCSFEGCTRSAEGQLGLCISHGGGRRCQYLQCTKGAQGSTMYCKAHGGGKRCIFQGCTKGAEGSTPFCKGHGGGKRCLFEGGGICPKSVHGGTDYCVAHGGGKRCNVPGCTRSARGRTDCCVRHGGGKRCKFEGCTKSAQGSTDFCKAHGGGKRCTWVQGCKKFARGKSGLCAAHGSMVAAQKVQDETVGVSGSMIVCGLFHGLISTSTTGTSVMGNELACSTASASSQSNIPRMPGLLPPQVLVPFPMKSTFSMSIGSKDCSESMSTNMERHVFVVPEGRVHNGSLMSLLGGDIRNAVIN